MTVKDKLSEVISKNYSQYIRTFPTVDYSDSISFVYIRHEIPEDFVCDDSYIFDYIFLVCSKSYIDNLISEAYENEVKVSISDIQASEREKIIPSLKKLSDRLYTKIKDYEREGIVRRLERCLKIFNTGEDDYDAVEDTSIMLSRG